MDSELPGDFGPHNAISELIRWNAPLSKLIGAATRNDGSEGPSVRLERSAVVDVLQRCVSGDLRLEDLPEWARVALQLDHVEIAEADVDLLTEFLHRVSSPELFGAVTTDVCTAWIRRLEPPVSLPDETRVETREDFVRFLEEMLIDLQHNPEEWENPTLKSFLDAWAAWVGALPRWYAKRGEEMPDQPDWKLLAAMVSAARIYE
ncbi:DUF7660 family protein [Streptomyces aurantiogriseus]|uniref:DUF7660 domain-containing protein n=1 Tax=Streptomyces aurantiogriseus TaxID=66870 RepID=A0A918F943_9ACTN|nr:hypothetical protein [Streptomyces aurantiogriseus]GGR17326.1 hypothetical protein GCM10010251_36870 [Streptomyces aurantiogriseus]